MNTVTTHEGDEFCIGRFRICVRYRRVANDEGITLQVYGPTDSGNEEVLRFDCFQHQPHYHLGWSYRKEPFIPIAADNSLGWAIQQLRSNANELLAAAGALPMDGEELAAFGDSLEDIWDAAKRAQPQ